MRYLADEHLGRSGLIAPDKRMSVRRNPWATAHLGHLELLGYGDGDGGDDEDEDDDDADHDGDETLTCAVQGPLHMAAAAMTYETASQTKCGAMLRHGMARGTPAAIRKARFMNVFTCIHDETHVCM